MKTYAFHSYKGGSGRTLALANFALFLRRKGKRVLMIDFDFDAPGLPYKFDKQNELKGGYVDYLMGTTSSERAQKNNRKMRLEVIRDFLIHIDDDNLKLLPAGDPGRAVYWKHLSSDEFHRLFSFAQYGESAPAVADSLAEHENWRAFKQDLKDIEEAAGRPEYCLVDCKAAQDSVAPPLLAWADHIVEFLHCNREGAFGTMMLLKMLETNELRTTKAEFTPVIARVPYGGRSGDVNSPRQQMQGEIASVIAKLDRSFVSDAEFPFNDLQVLVEQKEIEIGDVLLLNEMNSGEFHLSYNYVELFDSLTGLVTRKEKKESLIALKLNQEDEILEQIFRFSFRSGELLNKDGERNVALRKKTIVELMNSLANDQEMTLAKKKVSKKQRTREIAAAFENAGYKAGQSFGQEAITVREVWQKHNIPDTTLERLQQWCEFDRKAGFGDWTADYKPDLRTGEVSIKNHFLEGTHANLGSFFMLGYVRGVLGYLVGKIGTVARIRITRSSSTKIEFEYEGE